MKVLQKEIKLNEKARGFHLISDEIERKFPEMKIISKGIANIFILHTSAALTINENADPTVRQDFETFFNSLVPEDPKNYLHIHEGLDDMTSHIKNSIVGSSVSIPIKNGQFALGTWQGIYLCEFRNSLRSRKIIITIIGDSL